MELPLGLEVGLDGLELVSLRKAHCNGAKLRCQVFAVKRKQSKVVCLQSGWDR